MKSFLSQTGVGKNNAEASTERKKKERRITRRKLPQILKEPSCFTQSGYFSFTWYETLNDCGYKHAKQRHD